MKLHIEMRFLLYEYNKARTHTGRKEGRTHRVHFARGGGQRKRIFAIVVLPIPAVQYT